MDTTTFATAATSDEELAVEESIAALTTGDIEFDNYDSTEDLPTHTMKGELMGDINQTKVGTGDINLGNNGYVFAITNFVHIIYVIYTFLSLYINTHTIYVGISF